jgi:uncharacterized RDD family membrane protein YckC
MPNKVKTIALAVAVAGILSEITSAFSFLQGDSIRIIASISGMFSSLNLTVFNSSLLTYRNFDTGLTTNFVDLFFYALLLIGALVYNSRTRSETRLIRFVFAVVFISQVFFVLSAIISPFIYWQHLKDQKYWWLFWLISRAINALFIYLSLVVLKNTSSQPEIRVQEENGLQFPVPNPASNWQRLFHLIVDAYTCLLIFSPLTFLLGEKFLGFLESALGERGLIYVFLIIYRLVYYPFFEIIFGKTPAKYLTLTLVTDQNGNKVPAGTIMLRTFARFIPFEAFSFLGGNGWHDSLTATKVVREVRTGVKGRRYFWILPAFLVLGLGIYFAKEQYSEYQYRQNRISEHAETIKNLEYALDHLTTSSVIEIEDIAHSYSSKAIYFKVEEISGDELTVSVLQQEKDYSGSIFRLEKLYNQNQNYLSTLPVKLSELKKAYTPDYRNYKNYERNSADLLLDGRKFEIRKIEKFFCPVIREGGTEYYGNNELSMKFYNCGWPANLVEISTIEGSITWQNSLPERIETITSNEYPNFYLSGADYKYKSDLKFRIVLQDSLNNRHSFIIEKTRGGKKVYPE